jgi:hypothetical protein
MDGLDIVRRVYQRLRGPSQQALPYPRLLEIVRDVIARKKLDLALAQQNALGVTSEWFTPSATDFELDELGIDVLLPIRLETRAVGSEREIGDDVPLVNYEVLNTNTRGAASFYGDPLRLVFVDTTDYVTQQEYRIIYEEDFLDELGLTSIVGLPTFFKALVVLEAAYEALEIVEDDSPEWDAFSQRMERKWELQLVDKRQGWDDYVTQFKGRAQVPKRTFWDNRRRLPVEPRFRN